MQTPTETLVLYKRGVYSDGCCLDREGEATLRIASLNDLLQIDVQFKTLLSLQGKPVYSVFTVQMCNKKCIMRKDVVPYNVDQEDKHPPRPDRRLVKSDDV